MLVADHEWSHIANKKQMEKILELFDKVYGYSEGLSRMEEINKRYQKQRQNEFDDKYFSRCTLNHVHTEECGGLLSEEEQAKKLEKSVLQDMFSAGNNKDLSMVDRYSEFLNKILIQSGTEWFQDKHQKWVT